MSASRPILVICGATATGKTALSVQLAQRYRIEIVNADARQVYAGMEVGTAAPTFGQRSAVNHHFVATLQPDQEWSAAAFAQQARSVIDTMPPTTLPCVVGGAGLYITALTDGLSPELEATPAPVRADIKRFVDLHGRDAAWERLAEVDPAAAERYTDRNPRRLQRALEFYATTGRRISDTWTVEREIPPYNVIRVGLTMPRHMLYHRINERCGTMLEALVNETRALLARGITANCQSMQTVGYAEAIEFLRGTCTRDDMLQRFQQSTRRYAKRQETWFKRDARIVWFDATSPSLVDDIDAFLQHNGLDAYRLARIA